MESALKKFIGGRSGTSSFLKWPVGDFLYYVAFVVYSIDAGLGHSTISADSLSSALEVMALLLLVLKMAYERFDLKKWILAATITVIGFIAWRQSAEGWLFWAFLFVVCGSGIDLKKLAKLAFISSVTVVIVVVASCYFGFTENVTLLREGTNIVRNSFGFSHPNTFASYLLICGTSFVLCRFHRNLLINVLVLVAVALACWGLADSRTSAALAIFQIILLMIFHYVKKENARHTIASLMVALVFILVLMSFYFVFSFNNTNPLHNYLDDLTNMRFYWAHQNFLNSSITLFGDNFSNAQVLFYRDGEAKYFYVDNAYAHLLLRYGLIPTVTFLFGYGAALCSAVKSGRWDIVLYGLVVFAIYGLEETYALQIECNFLLVSMAPLVYGSSDDSFSLEHGAMRQQKATKPISNTAVD